MTRLKLHALGLAAVVAAGGLLAAADPPRPAAATAPTRVAGAAAATTQELLFFTADGPVRVRLTITLGGKLVPGPWQAALDALFAHCDRDGDGLLAAKEREVFNTGRRGDGEFIIVDGVGYAVPRMPNVSFAEKDGKVDRDAFRAGFLLAGLGPVSVSPVLPRGDSASLTDALVKRLDTDGDGKLSLAELKAARGRLAAVDANEDELLSTDELLNRVQNPYFGVQIVSFYDPSGRRPAPPQLAEVLVPAAGQPVAAKDVLGFRDKNKDGGLSAAELGVGPEAFAALDADGDDRLDAEELRAWLRQPPDLDLKVELTDPSAGRSWLPLPAGWLPTPATPGVGLLGKGRMADRAKPSPDGGLSADLRDARLRFEADAQAGLTAREQWRNNADSLRTAFEAVAKGKDALDRKQLADNSELSSAVPLFDFADRDGNGKLTKAEMDGVFRTGEALVNCRVTVTVTDQGRGLFELLDRDGDAVLSPREQDAAAGLVARLDRDGDGALARSEIPRGYSVSAKPASVDMTPNNVFYDFNVFSGPGRPGRAVAYAEGVPEWFKSADRNGDGDVSAREFAGPPALFKRIDADGDGLVSPAEATAFEKSRPR